MKQLNLRGLLKLSALLMVFRVGGAAMALILQACLARWFGVAELGIYALTIAVAGSLSIILGLGYPSITPRFVPAFLAEQRFGLLAAFLRSSRTHLTLMSAGAVAAGLIFLLLPDAILSPHLKLALGFGCLAAPLLGMIELNGALALSLRQPLISFLPDVLLKPILLLTSVLALIWLLPAPGIVLVLIALLAIMFTLASGQMLLVMRKSRPYLAAPATNAPVIDWRRAALPMTAVVILTSFVGDLDLLFLAALLPTEDIAIFSICFRFSMFLSFGVQMVYHLLMPDLSEAYASGRIDQISHKLRWANGLTVSFTAAACVMAALGGDYMLLLFGKEFLAGHYVLVIMMAVQLLAALFGPNAQLLNISGNQMKMIPIFGAGLAVLALLNLVLVPPFGLFGASLAFILAALFWQIRLSLTVLRQCGLHASVLGLIWNTRPAAAS